MNSRIHYQPCIVNKSGAWYAYEGNKIGQGRENAKTYLKENPAVCAEIDERVRAHFNLQGCDEAASEEVETKGAKASKKDE